MAGDLVHATGNSAGGRVFVALWGGLAVVDVAGAGGALLAGALVLVLVSACGIGQSRPAAVAIGTTGWLVINGFVQHQYGELGFGATSWSLLALVLVVVLTVAGRTCSQSDRR